MSSKTDIESIKPDFDIDEQLDMHRRGWKAQNVGLVFIFTMIFLAAIGMFGEGPVSKLSRTKETTTIVSERFFRHEARMELEVQMISKGETIVAFDNNYLKNVEVESIVPEPSKTTVEDNRVQYTFEANGPLAITFYLIPKQIGSISGNAAVNKATFELSHFIFP